MYQPGQRLPTAAALGREFATTVQVIGNALNLLVHEGLIDHRVGSPAWVRAPRPHRSVTLRPGDRVTARMPTPAERSHVDVSRGVPVFLVGDQVLPADRVTLVVPASGRESSPAAGAAFAVADASA